MIELLAVTAIMVVVTSVMLASHSRFGGVVQLENLAYDVALSIRQAQVYGIAVARFQQEFIAGYGVHFDIANRTTYKIFADAITRNGLYDCAYPGTDNCELVRTVEITGGYRISDICATAPGGSEICNTTDPTISKIDILFIRPEPNAWIRIPCFSCPQGVSFQAAARIALSSPRGDMRSVMVDTSGQISVKQP